VLHSFASVDGTHPIAGPFMLGDRLYGTCSQGGTNGSGTVYSLGTAGDFSVIYSFSAFDATARTNFDGFYSTSGVVPLGSQLYGTAQEGGVFGFGTMFALKVPSKNPAISGILFDPETGITLNFSDMAQNPILIQTATNPAASTAWQTVATNLPGMTSWSQPFDKNSPARFYRLLQQ
jgi:uncharacterized repeat protein (TIGR03803 family)